MAAEKDGPRDVPFWKRLNYPDEATFVALQDKFPLDAADENGPKHYNAIPAWIRLEWPDRELWDVAGRTAEIEMAPQRKERPPRPWPVASQRWSDVVAVCGSDEDARRLIRLWPDCYGQPLVVCELFLQDGITINNLTYGPGRHRVPRSVAVDLRRIDQAARQEFIDQYIPKVHQTKFAVVGMGAGGQAEIKTG